MISWSSEVCWTLMNTMRAETTEGWTVVCHDNTKATSVVRAQQNYVQVGMCWTQWGNSSWSYLFRLCDHSMNRFSSSGCVMPLIRICFHSPTVNVPSRSGLDRCSGVKPNWLSWGKNPLGRVRYWHWNSTRSHHQWYMSTVCADLPCSRES